MSTPAAARPPLSADEAAALNPFIPAAPSDPPSAPTVLARADGPAQPSLFDDVRYVSIEHRGLTNQEQFEAFHAANPWVYDHLVKMSRDWIAKGQKRCSMKMFFETLRYNYGIQTTDSEFKLNNNYTSWYQRKLASDDPALGATFAVRQIRTP